MANEKILQTRIVNKHALLSEWEQSILKLKEGEIALAKIMVPQPDGTEAPTYVAKIGLEESTYSESPMLFAPASDVYRWAKAPQKPDYVASEIGRGDSNVDTDLTAVETEINELKSAIGEGGSVEDAIKAAIEALDVEDSAVANQFVTAVAEADGKISVTRRALTDADIAALNVAKEKVTGLQDALNLKANAADLSDYETSNNAEVAAVRAIAEAATTVDEATSIAQGKVDELANGQVETNKEAIVANNAAIAALAGEGNTSTVKANADAIAKLSQDIGNVVNVMNFVGVSTTDPESEGGATIDGASYTGVSGDVIIYAEKEYVFDGSKWVKFGDASDSSTAISDLQTRVGNVEDAIEVINGTDDGSIAKAVADEATLRSNADTAINNKIGGSFDATNTVAKAITAAQTDIDNHKNAETAHTKAQVGLGNVDNKSVAEIKTEFTGAVADGNDKFVTGDAVYDAIEAAKSAAATTAQEKVDALADGAVKTNTQNIASNAADIATIENNYARVSGDKLVYGQDDAEMVIIFDCGGAE